MARVWCLMVCAVASTARADPAPGTPPPAPVLGPARDVPVNRVNLRAGASTTADRAEICFEAAPVKWLAVEGCGTGSGFLHQDPDPEMAHFRVKARLASWQAGAAWIEPRVGVGFAELQLDEDAAGFQFFGTDGVSTAGAEGTAAVRALFPAGRGWEFVAELTLSMAYLPYAPDLVRPHSAWQPAAGFTVGVGY
jgi:hypothetical protein